MKIRRTISIDKSDLEILKSFLDANSNNLSKALRQLIHEFAKQKSLNELTADQHRVMLIRNQIIENRIAELIPVPLVKWFARTSGGVPPLGTFRTISEKYAKLLGMDNITLNDYARIANTASSIFGYQLRQNIEMGQDSRSIRISFEAEDAQHLKFAVMIYSCMLAHQPFRLKTKKVLESPNNIIVDYEQCSSEEESYISVTDQFGHDQFIFDEIRNNIQFWKNILNILRANHYENLIISREIFIQILKSREFSGQLENLISSIYEVSIENTDYQNIIKFIGEILKTNGLIYGIEHDDNKIQVYHIFNERNIIRLINKTIINTLKMSGQHFVPGKENKTTILSRKVNI